MSLRTAVTVLGYDLKFQFRHGFYHVYFIVTALYIVLLRFLPAGIKTPAAVFFVFTDPCVLGLFFIGGIFLFEKSQHIHEGLFTTPLTLHRYLWSKVTSLTLLASASGFAIVLFTFGLNFNPLPLLVGLILSAALFTLIGITLAVRARTLNQYLFTSPLYIVPLLLPLAGYLELFHSPLFYALPAQASLMLIDASLTGLSAGGLAYAVALLLLWIALAYWWAYRWFDRYVILSLGGGRQ